MTFNELKLHIRAVTHRSDLTDDLFDRWNFTAAGELTNDVQSNSGLTVETVTFLINPSFVGNPNAEVISVEGTSSGGRTYKLQATSREQVTEYLNATGDPLFYNSDGRAIRIAPYTFGQQLSVTYRDAVPEFSSGGTNTFLSLKHPRLYVNLFLSYAYEYLKDFESADRYRLLYQSEAASINNRDRDIKALENTQMSGASDWHSVQGEA